MDYLPFTLPQFTRLLWTSAQAREVWEPRINLVTSELQKAEYLLVQNGTRIAALQFITPKALIPLTQAMLKIGLSVVPMSQEGLTNGSNTYLSATLPYTEGNPWWYRVFICLPENVDAVLQIPLESTERADSSELVGRILGYPPCCRDFYSATWVSRGLIDMTWLSAEQTFVKETSPTESTNIIELNNLDYRNNLLLRWCGVRPVPYLPCSFHCEATRDYADNILNTFSPITRDIGEEMLSWPVEWNALHGIAEIKTPIFKISSSTDATPTNYVVRARGARYPLEGASGLEFPYRNEANVVLTEGRAFNSVAFETTSWYYEDNGFHSFTDMLEFHKPILSLLRNVKYEHIVDVGCGNGVLLHSALRSQNDTQVYGCDTEQDRIDHARLLHNDNADFQVMDFKEYCELMKDTVFDVGICGIMRFVEEGTSVSAKAVLQQFIKNNCKQIIFYAYAPQVENGQIKTIMDRSNLGDYTIINEAANYSESGSCITAACLVTIP